MHRKIQTHTHTYAKKVKQEQAKMGLHTWMQVVILARKALLSVPPLLEGNTAGLLPQHLGDPCFLGDHYLRASDGGYDSSLESPAPLCG